MHAIDQMAAFLRQFPAEPDCFYASRLAVEEMGTNILKYGYDDQSEHTITLRAECADEDFLLTLEDDGHPFNPASAPEADPCLKLEDRQPGGWGICLVRRLARRIEYQRLEERNILKLWISRKAAPSCV